MCGRYYIDKETVREAGKIVHISETSTVQKEQSEEQKKNLKDEKDCKDTKKTAGQQKHLDDKKNDKKFQKMIGQQDKTICDICPGDTIDLILGREGKILFEKATWGFPEKTLMINARSETVCERIMFRDSIYHSRAAIPAAGFYEWNQEKEKNMFFGMIKRFYF